MLSEIRTWQMSHMGLAVLGLKATRSCFPTTGFAVWTLFFHGKKKKKMRERGLCQRRKEGSRANVTNDAELHHAISPDYAATTNSAPPGPATCVPLVRIRTRNSQRGASSKKRVFFAPSIFFFPSASSTPDVSPLVAGAAHDGVVGAAHEGGRRCRAKFAERLHG